MPMHLFLHNQTAYEAAVRMLAERGKAAVIHPTGTGKSFIGFKLCEDDPDKTICWLSPSRYIYQTQLENLAETSDGYQPENVKFYTYAKLMNADDDEITDIKPDYIILDEFHRCGAEFWGRGVDKLLKTYPDVPVLGLSATAIRYLDNQRDMTDELFDGNVASEMTLGEAIVRGILNPPKYVLTVYSYQKELERYETKISGVKSLAARDEATKYLEALRRALEMAEGLDKIFEKHIENKAGKYIVFCSSLEAMNFAAEEAENWFANIDREPHIYKAYSNDPETSKAFAGFKADNSEHLKLLYCIDMLNEGVHVEDISGVILLRPTVSPIIYKQQIGRALSASKYTNAVIFDVVNNIENLYSIDTVKEEMQAAISYYRYTGENTLIVNDTFEVLDEVRDCRALFDQLEGVLSAGWDLMFDKAEEYYKQNGDLIIPSTYHTDEGYALGRWLTTQRLAYAGKADKPLTQVQINKLESIGVVWDSHLDFIWNRYFEKAKEYYEQHGDLYVPKDYIVDGLKLGIWILRMRRAQADRRETVVTPEKKAKLDSIGMVWNPLSEQWERNYLEAMNYFNEHGNLYMDIKYMTETGFKLGYWISRLRHKKDELSEEQVSRLNRIGMVWDTEQYRFDEGLVHAKKYFTQHGDLKVPVKYVCDDGYTLGLWINLKRRLYAGGKLSDENIAALEQLGISWNPTADQWQAMYNEAKRYYDENGNLDVPRDNAQLYNWLTRQRNTRSKGQMKDYQIKMLDDISMIWNLFDYRWNIYYDAVAEYCQDNSIDELTAQYVSEKGLRIGEWLARQRKLYREDSLDDDKAERLAKLGLKLEKDTQMSVLWDMHFRELAEYIAENGQSIPKTYVTESGTKLAFWLSDQKKRYRQGKLSKEYSDKLRSIGVSL